LRCILVMFIKKVRNKIFCKFSGGINGNGFGRSLQYGD